MGRLEVLLDVDAERLEGGDVDDLGLVGDVLAALVGLVELVDADEEAAQGLAGAGGRGDEGVLSGGDGGPGAELRRRRPLGERRSNHVRTAGWNSSSTLHPPPGPA